MLKKWSFQVSGVGFQEKVAVEYNIRDTKDMKPAGVRYLR